MSILNSNNPVNASISAPTNGYVTIGSSGYSQDNITLTTNSHDTMMWDSSISLTGPFTPSSGSIHATGDVIIDGDLKIQGESIKDLLEEIKDKLAIFKPNTELEERWDTLRELRRQYLELEKDILEKEEIIRILKR